MSRFIRVGKYVKRIGEGWLPTAGVGVYPTNKAMQSSLFLDLENESQLQSTYLGKIQITYYVKFKGRKNAL